MPVMGVFGVWILIASLVYSLHDLRSDLDMYAMPRTLTKSQATDLTDFLRSQQFTSDVYIRVAEDDEEANRYAIDLSKALLAANWNVSFDWSVPATKKGLNASWLGKEPQNAKQNPRVLIEQALMAANVPFGSGGVFGNGTGDYKYFLLVGPRPQRVGGRLPLSWRIGNWIRDKLQGLGEPVH
jgi:hypothetical protein